MNHMGHAITGSPFCMLMDTTRRAAGGSRLCRGYQRRAASPSSVYADALSGRGQPPYGNTGVRSDKALISHASASDVGGLKNG